MAPLGVLVRYLKPFLVGIMTLALSAAISAESPSAPCSAAEHQLKARLRPAALLNTGHSIFGSESGTSTARPGSWPGRTASSARSEAVSCMSAMTLAVDTAVRASISMTGRGKCGTRRG